MPQIIGIFGGTFDPIHNGHLAIAAAAVRQLALDLLLLVPNALSPLKTSGPFASFEHRVSMLQLGIIGNPEYAVSEIEGHRGGTSYTIDTLHELSRLYRDADFVVIVGADALAEFHLWRRHEEIRELARIAVAGRSGSKAATAGVDAMRLEMPPVDVSSTMIRDRVRRGLTIDGFVPPAVAEYIAEQRLYTT